MRKLIPFALVVLVGLSVGALAANQLVHQQGRVFSFESLTIKKREALTFLNDDSVPHNIDFTVDQAGSQTFYKQDPLARLSKVIPA